MRAALLLLVLATLLLPNAAASGYSASGSAPCTLIDSGLAPLPCTESASGSYLASCSGSTCSVRVTGSASGTSLAPTPKAVESLLLLPGAFAYNICHGGASPGYSAYCSGSVLSPTFDVAPGTCRELRIDVYFYDLDAAYQTPINGGEFPLYRADMTLPLSVCNV